jgi:hypothetical protein
MEGKMYGPPYGMQLNAKNGQISFFFFFFFFWSFRKIQLDKNEQEGFFFILEIVKNKLVRN